MDRLIYKDEFGEYVMNQPKERKRGIGAKDIQEKLWEYESSGLSPEQVQELAKAKAEGQLIILDARKEVIVFVEAIARAMEAELKENDYKGSWKDCSIGFLLDKLNEEHEELYEIVIKHVRAPSVQKESMLQEILSEAADVGNIAMMIADVCGALEGGKHNGDS